MLIQYLHAGQKAGFDIISLAPFAAVFVIFYMLVIRPQNKKMQEHKKMVETLKKGSKVVTTSGIIGLVHKLDSDQEMTLEIADGIKVKFLRNTISHVVHDTK